MSDETTPAIKGTGDGTSVSPLQFWSGILSVILTAIGGYVMQGMQMYYANQRETAKNARDEQTKAAIKTVIENQDTTHDEIKAVVVQQVKAAENVATTAAKVEEIHAATTAIADKVEAKPASAASQ